MVPAAALGLRPPGPAKTPPWLTWNPPWAALGSTAEAPPTAASGRRRTSKPTDTVPPASPLSRSATGLVTVPLPLPMAQTSCAVNVARPRRSQEPTSTVWAASSATAALLCHTSTARRILEGGIRPTGSAPRSNRSQPWRGRDFAANAARPPPPPRELLTATTTRSESTSSRDARATSFTLTASHPPPTPLPSSQSAETSLPARNATWAVGSPSAFSGSCSPGQAPRGGGTSATSALSAAKSGLSNPRTEASSTELVMLGQGLGSATAMVSVGASSIGGAVAPAPASSASPPSPPMALAIALLSFWALARTESHVGWLRACDAPAMAPVLSTKADLG